MQCFVFPLREIKFFLYKSNSKKNRLIVLCFTLAQLSLLSQASWDQNAVTVTGLSNGTAGSSISQLNSPWGIRVSNNDVLYISDFDNNRVVIVDLNSTNNIFIIGSGSGSNPNQFNQPYDLIVTNTSLYVLDAGNDRVQETSLNGSNPSTVLGYSGLAGPYYLYIDNNGNIYLSDTVNNRVLFFHSNSTNFTMVAGTGVQGSNNTQLNSPNGIFVNQNGTIYIADHLNHRIMKWYSGATTGIMVAGTGTNGSSSTQLSYPTQIIVDTSDYMYISEGGNSRITRWPPNSTYGECITACTGTTGTASTQLNWPQSLAFDSNGSLYVSDTSKNRIQKFQILPNNSKY
jgi:sugar lactone lactonase YvrE